ncbi:hypothetical protein LguiB_014006 [Lonicera macranthoides]
MSGPKFEGRNKASSIYTLLNKERGEGARRFDSIPPFRIKMPNKAHHNLHSKRQMRLDFYISQMEKI